MIQKISLSVLALATIGASTLDARSLVNNEDGIIVVQMTGQSSAPVENITISGSLDALYQPDAATSRNSVAKVAVEVKRILTEYSDKSDGSVRIRGGFAIPHAEIEYVDRDVKLKFPGLWKSTVTFTLILPFSEENQDRLAELQNQLLELTRTQPKEEGAATIQLSLREPREGVSEKTLARLQAEALNSAIAKAKNEKNQIARNFDLGVVRLIRVQPLTNDSGEAAELSAPGSPPEAVPYSFGNYTVYETREFVFKFEP